MATRCDELSERLAKLEVLGVPVGWQRRVRCGLGSISNSERRGGPMPPRWRATLQTKGCTARGTRSARGTRDLRRDRPEN
jgi:hypothetical protein